MHLAAHAGWVDITQDLIDSGSDLEAVDHNGFTPLLVAARNASCGTMERLLASGADVFAKDASGDTACHLPGRQFTKSHIDDSIAFRCFEILESAGLQVDVPNAKALTPLMVAILFNHVTMVQALENIGARLDLVDQYEQSILHCAGRYANYDMIQALRTMEIESVNPDSEDRWGITPESVFRFRMDSQEDELSAMQKKPTDEEIQLFFLLLEEIRERYERYRERTATESGATSPKRLGDQREDSEDEEPEWETCSEGSDGESELNVDLSGRAEKNGHGSQGLAGCD